MLAARGTELVASFRVAALVAVLACALSAAVAYTTLAQLRPPAAAPPADGT